MKYTETTHITSNEQDVRLRIYEGDLQISDAAQELLHLEREQRKAADRRLRLLIASMQMNLQTKWFRANLRRAPSRHRLGP